MSSIPLPGTVSPAKLTLHYSLYSSVLHSASVRLVAGVDIQDVASLRADAVSLGTKLAAVLDSGHYINAWSVTMPDGRTGYIEPFEKSIIGTHSNNGQNSLSFSLTIIGKAVGVAVGAAAGRTKFIIFPGGIINVPAGSKYLPESVDLAIKALCDNLNASTRYFADTFGQKADTAGRVSVQFNAHVQRTLGT